MRFMGHPYLHFIYFLAVSNDSFLIDDLCMLCHEYIAFSNNYNIAINFHLNYHAHFTILLYFVMSILFRMYFLYFTEIS